MLTLVLIVLGLYAGINLACAWSFLHPPREVATMMPGMKASRFTGPGGEVPVFVSDNLQQARVVFICAHGYLGNRNSFDGIADSLMKDGYGVAIPAMPGQDASPASEVGFGPSEAETIADCVDFVRKYSPQAKVVLLGISLGGAASWMASAERPTEVSAVVTEGAFAHRSPAVTSGLNRRVPFGAILLRPSAWIAELISGLRINQVNPVAAAAKWKGPGLVIQAGSDELISRDNADDLSQAAGVPEWVVSGAHHAHCFAVDPDGYRARLEAIVAKVLTAHA